MTWIITGCVADGKTITKSFSIRKHYADVLEDVARERNVSVSSIVNEIIERFVEFDIPASGARILEINDHMFRFLMEQIPKDKIIEFAKSFAQDPVAGGKALPEMSKQELINAMKLHCKYNGLKFVETTHESKLIIIIAHEIGLNTSHWIGTYYKSLFESIGVKIDYSADENTVVFHFG